MSQQPRDEQSLSRSAPARHVARIGIAHVLTEHANRPAMAMSAVGNRRRLAERQPWAQSGQAEFRRCWPKAACPLWSARRAKAAIAIGRPSGCWRPNQAVTQRIQWSPKVDAWSYSVLNLARVQGSAPLCRPRRSLSRIFIDWMAAGCRRLCPPLRAFSWAINLPYGITAVRFTKPTSAGSV